MNEISDFSEPVFLSLGKAWLVLRAIGIIFCFALVYIICGFGSLLALPFFLREQKKKESAASSLMSP